MQGRCRRGHPDAVVPRRVQTNSHGVDTQTGRVMLEVDSEYRASIEECKVSRTELKFTKHRQWFTKAGNGTAQS